MTAESLARLDHYLRPLMTLLPPKMGVRLYSYGRKLFLHKFEECLPSRRTVPEQFSRSLWGITFSSPIFNAAGMFKNGESYHVCAQQGAGAYLAGTVTARPRIGNSRQNIPLPFAPYPRSGTASNWLGLPNEGHAVVAKRIQSLEKVQGCPIGISVMTDPNVTELTALAEMVEGLQWYDKANVDFIEINESCPNAGHNEGMGALALRLEYLQRHFLRQRKRKLPVIVKFSNDTEPIQIPKLIDMLLSLEFDGVNFGNTSTQYQTHLQFIHDKERPLYEYFTNTFGGGISGIPLRESSLSLSSKAAMYCRHKELPREFWVIRTGGISCAADIAESEKAGIALSQWYTGYFSAFAEQGHDVYANLYNELLQKYSHLLRPALYYEFPPTPSLL